MQAAAGALGDELRQVLKVEDEHDDDAVLVLHRHHIHQAPETRSCRGERGSDWGPEARVAQSFGGTLFLNGSNSHWVHAVRAVEGVQSSVSCCSPAPVGCILPLIFYIPDSHLY